MLSNAHVEDSVFNSQSGPGAAMEDPGGSMDDPGGGDDDLIVDDLHVYVWPMISPLPLRRPSDSFNSAQ